MQIESRKLSSTSSVADSLPLFVDLDGTLIKTDLLVESFFALIKRNPLYFFYIPVWLLHGKAYLKHEIAKRVEIDVTLLPYHKKFLAFLRAEAATGRELILATASNEKPARQLAEHLGIFKKVLASTAKLNLSGARKLESIVAICGQNDFDYAGNEKKDLKIWPHARHALLVNPENGVEKSAQKVAEVAQVFEERKKGIKPYVKAIRVHQWLKNLLLFVPLLTTVHEWQNTALILKTMQGFIAFSLCASSVYLLNDLLDLPSDRIHPRKKKRPFAAGDISLLHGVALMLLLLATGLLVGATLSLEFIGVLIFYFILTLAYSLHLKSRVLIDVMLLAGLYTLRIIAGAAAIMVAPSFWLLAFSMFLFLSLALAKRCSELASLMKQNKNDTKGRGYRVADLEYLHSMGTASGYLSVLVLAFFINNAHVIKSYTYPEVLWLLCPLILYWISRIWLWTGRGNMHDDPIVFTLKDRGSRYVIVVGIVLVLLTAQGFK